MDQNNQQIGVVDTRDALRMAEEAGLDLVEIQADIRPPVCKIMDYGRFRFEQGKKDRANRAASKAVEMKEVRLGRSAKIDDHDVMIRVQQARGFLMDGHKVQFVQNFKGREMAHRDIGEDRLKDIVQALSDIAKVETGMKLFGKKLSMIMAPDKVKVEAIKRKLEKEKAAKNGTAASPKADQPAKQPDAPDAAPAAKPAKPAPAPVATKSPAESATAS